MSNLKQEKKRKEKDGGKSPVEEEGNVPRGIDSKMNSSSQQGYTLNEKEKLIDQNIKLKTQIFDLSKQLQELMGKEGQKKKKYGISDEDDEATKTKKQELKRQQLEVLSLKNKIHSIKRQLETVHNNRTLVAKEDELKYLRSQLDNLEEEKKSLIKIKSQQTKALKTLKNEEQYEEKIDQLKKQLHSVKEESKVLNEKLIQSERILRKNHEQFIVKQNKVKELEQKVHMAQKKAKNRKPIQNVSAEQISQLEDQITQLENDRKQTEKVWHDKINAIDTELREKKNDQEKKLMLLKEKQKQLKLNELKIKQLRRLIKHNISESEGTSKHQDADMNQYRHKRNIKYMRDDKNQ